MPKKKYIFLFFSLFLYSLTVSYAAKNPIVIIDPGHGGKDKGAYHGFLREKDLSLKVALYLKQLIQSQTGYTVYLTRRSDRFVSLKDRVRIANRLYRKGNTIFISIHFNSARRKSAKGIETFYFGKKSKRLASSVQKHTVNRLKAINRGVKRHHYYVLRKTKGKAIIIECGFISNSSERRKIKKKRYQTALAETIFQGINSHYSRANKPRRFWFSKN